MVAKPLATAIKFWCKKLSVVCFGERPFRAETQEVVRVNDNAVFTYLLLFVVRPRRTIVVRLDGHLRCIAIMIIVTRNDMLETN